MNAAMSKVMVSERRKIEMLDSAMVNRFNKSIELKYKAKNKWYIVGEVREF